jgi:hypothetical protein
LADSECELQDLPSFRIGRDGEQLPFFAVGCPGPDLYHREAAPGIPNHVPFASTCRAVPSSDSFPPLPGPPTFLPIGTRVPAMRTRLWIPAWRDFGAAGEHSSFPAALPSRTRATLSSCRFGAAANNAQRKLNPLLEPTYRYRSLQACRQFRVIAEVVTSGLPVGRSLVRNSFR